MSWSVFVCLCLRWLGGYPTGMTIIEVGVLTGYVVDNVDDLRNQAGGVIRRVDSDTSSLALYLDQVNTLSTLIVRWFTVATSGAFVTDDTVRCE